MLRCLPRLTGARRLWGALGTELGDLASNHVLISGRKTRSLGRDGQEDLSSGPGTRALPAPSPSTASHCLLHVRPALPDPQPRGWRVHGGGPRREHFRARAGPGPSRMLVAACHPAGWTAHPFGRRGNRGSEPSCDSPEGGRAGVGCGLSARLPSETQQVGGGQSKCSTVLLGKPGPRGGSVLDLGEEVDRPPSTGSGARAQVQIHKVGPVPRSLLCSSRPCKRGPQEDPPCGLLKA